MRALRPSLSFDIDGLVELGALVVIWFEMAWLLIGLEVVVDGLRSVRRESCAMSIEAVDKVILTYQEHRHCLRTCP